MTLMDSIEMQRRVDLALKDGKLSLPLNFFRLHLEEQVRAIARAKKAPPLKPKITSILLPKSAKIIWPTDIPRSGPLGESFGYVTAAGGRRYQELLAYSLAKLPDYAKCEVWYCGERDRPIGLEKFFANDWIKFRDASLLGFYPQAPMQWRGGNYKPHQMLGFGLKPFAVLHSAFNWGVWFDADCFILDAAPISPYGLVPIRGLPDVSVAARKPEETAWFGLKLEGPEMESGAFNFAKNPGHYDLFWLTNWLANHSRAFEFTYGDKDLWRIAAEFLGKPGAVQLYEELPEQIDGALHHAKGKIVHDCAKRWDAKPALSEKQEQRHQAARRAIWPSLRNSTTDAEIWGAVYEGNEYGLPERFGAGFKIIDVGAHIGSFSSACLMRGASAILAVEPDRDNFELLQANLERFGKAARCLNRAVGMGLLGLKRIAGRPECTMTTEPGGASEVIGTETIDDLIRSMGNVNLLKLDCEGAEWEAIWNCSMLRQVERIVVELHSDAWKRHEMGIGGAARMDSWPSLRNFLQDQGFTVKRDDVQVGYQGVRLWTLGCAYLERKGCEPSFF